MNTIRELKQQEKYNNMLKRKNKEIERQKEVINGMIDNEEKYNLEINKLKSIIKEVREWANKTIFYFDFKEEITKHTFDLLYTKQGQELLEILEKENK